MKILGIHFAPLSIPIERRIQTLALTWALSTYFFGFLTLFVFIGILFTRYYYAALFYFAWLFYDRHTPKRGNFFAK